MNITRYTDYSLRCLVYLAVNKAQHCTINDIATSYGISKNHLMKVIQALAQKGLVLSVRGKNGGISLNKPAQEINIGEVVRWFEDKSRLVECFGTNNQCVITPGCQLKNMLYRAQESFFATLDQFTLQDLLGERDTKILSEVLQIQTSLTQERTLQ